jgi:CubicO group peptidase (beta-lactamase class C family)
MGEISKVTRRSFLAGSLVSLAAPLSSYGAKRQETTPNLTSAKITPAELQAMEEVVTSFMKKYAVPGMSIAIADHGELAYQQGFGYADIAAKDAVTPQHLFRIASLSKPFTSSAVMRLIQRGKLRLSDLVFGDRGVLGSDYGKPPYKPYVAELTIEHLLTHTGGGWTNDRTDPMFTNVELDHHDLITRTISTTPLSYPPGTHYGYSNFGYCILGRVLEKLTGMPYEAHIQQEILRPCGIQNMRIAGNTLRERAAKEVTYYGQAGSNSPQSSENPYNMNVRRMDSHGGWLGAPSDLVNFLVRVDGFPTIPDILQTDTIRAMTTPSSANDRYAKGWSVNPSQNWWHTGSLPGTQTIMVRTNSQFCWAALTNTRQPGSSMDADLDNLVWNIVHKVSAWRSA